VNTVTDALCIRPALTDEADLLTAVVWRSKAYWGYDAAFMAWARPQMVITADDVAAGGVYAALLDERIVGVLRLTTRGEVGWLEDLFVEPDCMGRGIGRALFAFIVDAARAAGLTRLEFESDPNAEGFYLALGAVRIGTVENRPGRHVPIMMYPLG
jgi:GNAT superfamily N-acetyltransferase